MLEETLLEYTYFKQRRIVGDKVRRERRSTSADEHQPESDICAQCKDAGTIVMPTGEMYKVCAEGVNKTV